LSSLHAAGLTLALVLAQKPAGEEPRAARPLTGTWSGTLSHAGESVPVGFEFESSPDGLSTVRLTLPAIHLDRVPVARGRPVEKDGELRIEPFAFRHDAAAGTLVGTIPDGLAPVYAIPFTLRRTSPDVLKAAPRAVPACPTAAPAWTYDAGAPLWAGATYADGLVMFGGEDGQLHALDARTGERRWVFRAGGPIRVRPTVAAGHVYFQADDGYLYRLDARAGLRRWRVRVVETPIVRLPFHDPKSRFDRFGADVTVEGERLYVGTHDGRVLALAAADGARLWEHATGDSILAAPAVSGGRVYAGSYDKHVHALDAATGRLAWKRDLLGAVVSTPAIEGDRVVVGTRSYDLFGLDAASGEVAWKRYVWFSWVESSASIRDGVAYVGSSDAAAAYAFEARSGRPIWKTDVLGWAWGQPAVSEARVFVGTSSQPGYMGDVHRGGALALDRRTGQPVWRFSATPPVVPGRDAPKPTYGFPGSPALGVGLVFFTGLDGRAYAFPQ
jgi:outer membrane protein assembly factor BamB